MKFLGYFAITFLVLSLTAGEARGYHVPPWDTGHNSFDPDPGDDGTDPGTDDGCNCSPCSQKTGSPVEVASGNFIYRMRPLLISGLGPAINLTLTYNSSDLRRGPFGVGWVHPYEQRIVEVVDEGGMGEIIMYAICAKSNGKRERFIRAQDGSYISPPYVFSRLTKNADGTFTLRDKYGVVQRFNTQGLLSATVDRNGNTLSISYDATGFMTKITDASGRVVTFAKGADGKVESITDPANRVLRFSYDAAGNLTSYKDTLGNSHTYKYDTANNLTAIVDPRGNTQQTLTYDSARRVARHVEESETWTYTYSPTQKRTIKRDSANNTWTYDYNENGNVTKITDPVGKVEQYVLDASLNVTQYTDKNGNTTKYTYDSVGNQLTITDALNNIRSIAYSPTVNLPVAVKDGLGNTTRLEYDEKGNLLKIINALGNEMRLQYDSKGLLILVTNALSSTSGFKYDNFGNLIQTTDQLGHISTATYDILGKILTVTDSEGGTTRHSYDDFERLVSILNAAGGKITYEYDASSNLISITTPSSAKTVFQYDSLNRLSRVTNSLGEVTNFSYDRRGNLASKTNAKGQSITYIYDALNRLIRKTKPDDVTAFSYDAKGNMLSAADNDSNLSFVYDALNRLISVRTIATSSQPETLTRYSYDANGNRLTMLAPSGKITNYSYDAVQRVTAIKEAEQEFTFTYDAISRRVKVDRPLGLSTVYTYDAANRLTSLIHQGGAKTLPFNYTYDRIGNIITKSDTMGQHSFNYDQLYRLSTVKTTQGISEESYSYDTVGNRVNSHISSSYSYNSANRMNTDSVFDYIFDSNGNLTRKIERATNKSTSYTYDSENQLTRIDFPDGTFALYRYDSLGRRIEKRAQGQIKQYVYDGQRVIAEYSDGQLFAQHLYGPGVDEIVSSQQSQQAGGRILYQTDVLGSVINAISADGRATAYAYDSFGRIISGASTGQQFYRFQGREFDQESGFYYFRARYYNPETGRFVTEDPIGFDAGVNFYQFALNNPINWIDPQGLEEEASQSTIENIIDAISAGLTAADLVLAGPTGEGIGPALILQCIKKGIKEEAKRQIKRLSKDEIKKLIKKGVHPHDLKPKKNGSKYDLFKDEKGNIEVRPKSGQGQGDPTGININDL
jgi:RHS repeat-associated protein